MASHRFLCLASAFVALVATVAAQTPPRSKPHAVVATTPDLASLCRVVGGGAFDRAQDPWRADRVRVSPMLSYQTSEYSRVRLQYNWDDSDHLDEVVHSVWLGFEVLIGPHQPHSY